MNSKIKLPQSYQTASSPLMIGVRATKPKPHEEWIRGRNWCANPFLFYFIFHFILYSLSHLVTTSSLSPSPSLPIRLPIHPPCVCSFLPTPIHSNNSSLQFASVPQFQQRLHHRTSPLRRRAFYQRVEIRHKKRSTMLLLSSF